MYQVNLVLDGQQGRIGIAVDVRQKLFRGNKMKYKIIDVIRPRYCSECPHMNMNLDAEENIICDKYDRPVDLFTGKKPSFCIVEEVMIVNE